MVSYAPLAATGPNVLVSRAAPVAAGIGIGSVETAGHATGAATAAVEVRGSAFRLLAAIRAVGDLVASAVNRVVWTLAAPVPASAPAAGAMVATLVALLGVATRGSGHAAGAGAGAGAAHATGAGAGA